MRIHSLVHRDDAKNESGFAMVILTGEEIISLNNLLYGATKSMTGKRTLLELAKEVKLLNAIVQHGGLDSFDIETLAEVDARSRGEKREGCMKGADNPKLTVLSATGTEVCCLMCGHYAPTLKQWNGEERKK